MLPCHTPQCICLCVCVFVCAYVCVWGLHLNVYVHLPALTRAAPPKAQANKHTVERSSNTPVGTEEWWLKKCVFVCISMYVLYISSVIFQT